MKIPLALSYERIRSKLIQLSTVKGNNDPYICTILDALWKRLYLQKSVRSQKFLLCQYAAYDIIPRSVILKLLIKSHDVKLYLIVFMNTLAGEAIGRRYLLQVDQGKPEL